eukprot:3725267-Lingulodinium_polyedra.AAC.1
MCKETAPREYLTSGDLGGAFVLYAHIEVAFPNACNHQVILSVLSEGTSRQLVLTRVLKGLAQLEVQPVSPKRGGISGEDIARVRVFSPRARPGEAWGK